MASTSKVVRGPKANAGQISALIEYMMEHRDLAAGRLCGMRGRERLATWWLELCTLLNQLGPHKNVVQWQKVWTELKYKARSRATLFRAGRLATGNKPNNEPGLNDNEKKIIMIMGIETAEGYCVADSLPEGQEDLERAIEGTAVPSVEDDPPQVFLEEMLEIPTELLLVMEQDPDDPAHAGQVETLSVVKNLSPLAAVPSLKRRSSEKGTPQRAPKAQRLRTTIQESREQFAELQTGQTELLRMMAENISEQTSAIKGLTVAMNSIKELVERLCSTAEDKKNNCRCSK